MSDTAPSGRRRASRALKITLLVLAAIVVLPVGFVTYFLFKTDVWEGDVPAVVRSVADYGTSVEFSGPLPPDALRSGSIDSNLVQDTPEGVQVGETLTCRVRQTYQNNTDIGYGPRTKILRCRR
jgi:hypothetical protein